MKNQQLRSIILLLLCSILITGCLFRDNRKFQELSRILQQGNEAMTAKRYNEAIKYYDSGLAIEPDEVVFLSKKAVALNFRGTEAFNAAVRLTDERAKNAGKEAAKRDFLEAKKIAEKVVNEINSSNPISSLDPAFKELKASVYASLAESLRLIDITVDSS